MQLFRYLIPTLLLLTAATGSWAADPVVGKIAEEFKPLSGVVIMQVGEEYLIDLDASRGVAEGDLFSAVVPGERVVHPVTGEVLGTLDDVKGLLTVTRVKSGYSYARPLGDLKALAKGDVIKRYENIKAGFWDYNGDGEPLFADLRDALPGLEWQSYAAAQAQRPEMPKPLPGGDPPLIFLLRQGQLEVRGSMFQVLASFAVGSPVVAANPVVTAPAVSSPPVAVAATLHPKSAVMTTAGPSVQAGIQQPAPSTTSAIVQQEQTQSGDIWTGFEWPGNPAGFEVADFDLDGQNEIAVLFKQKLEIERISGGNREHIISLPLPRIDKALTISSADLDGDGKPELFISAVTGWKVTSMVVAERNGSYQVVQENLNWFLRAMQLPEGGKVVLGQRLGNDLNLYDTDVIRLAWTGKEYGSAGIYPRPWQTSIFSLQAFADEQGELQFAEISINDRIRVFTPDARERWESSTLYGGAVNFFQIPDHTGGADFATKDIYLRPRTALNGDGLLLAPLNEGLRFSTLNALGPCQVVALKWDGTTMVEQWHTKSQDGTLADFVLADIDNDGAQEMTLLILFNREGMLNPGKAGLRVFEF
jgi:hypothetical protein